MGELIGERNRETVKGKERERDRDRQRERETERERGGSEGEREKEGEYENRKGKEKSLKNRCAKIVRLYYEREHSVLSLLLARGGEI